MDFFARSGKDAGNRKLTVEDVFRKYTNSTKGEKIIHVQKYDLCP